MMSSDKGPSTSTSGDTTDESSPTDTPTPPRQFEPIAREADDDEPTNTTGISRRSRPPHIASNKGNPNYGMFILFQGKALSKNACSIPSFRLDRILCDC